MLQAYTLTICRGAFGRMKAETASLSSIVLVEQKAGPVEPDMVNTSEGNSVANEICNQR